MAKVFRSFLPFLMGLGLFVLPSQLFADNTITVELSYSETEISQPIIDAFMKANPTIKVERSDFAEASLMTKVAAGNPPNIWRGYSWEVPYFAERDILLGLDDYVKNSTKIKASDFTPQCNEYRYDLKTKKQGSGTLFGFGKDYSVATGFFYRRDYWQQTGLPLPSETTPITYEKFFDAVKKMKKVDASGHNARWGYEGCFWEFQKMLTMLCAIDGNPLFSADKKKINFANNPTVKQYVKLYYDVCVGAKATQSILEPAPTGVWLPQELGDATGRIAVYQYGYWAGQLWAASPALSQIGYAPSPLWNNKKAITTGGPTGFLFGKYQDKKINDATWKLAEAVVDGEAAIERAKAGWGMPMFKSLQQNLPNKTDFDKMRLRVTLADANDPAVFISTGNPYAKSSIDTAVDKYTKDFYTGALSVDDFIAKVDADANSILTDGVNNF